MTYYGGGSDKFRITFAPSVSVSYCQCHIGFVCSLTWRQRDIHKYRYEQLRFADKLHNVSASDASFRLSLLIFYS
jgi:hypothetical protein